VLVNLFFNLTLIHHFSHVGMAMATSIAGWVNVGMMAYILHKRGIFVPDALLKSRLLKLLVASVIMMVALVIVQQYFVSFYMQGTWMKIAGLSSVIAMGATVFGLSVLALKAYDVELVNQLIRRKK
jgi:putative peptidoglycan lipid II flippase